MKTQFTSPDRPNTQKEIIMNKSKLFAMSIVTLIVTSLLSGCAGLSMFGEKVNQAFNGVPASMTTYTQQGVEIDRIKGTSFRVSRDDRFDTTDDSGSSNKDSAVLLISLGKSHISHVGSSMILAQDGAQNIMNDTNTRVTTESTKPGTPWLNGFIEKHRNLWSGKSKPLMIRSQDGTPIAVYAGNNVEMFATDVPKSTWFRVDGKMVFVYRCDFTVIDNELLQK